MEIVKVKLSKLKPYKNNAKKHPESQIEHIKESIQKFGMNDPIAIWGENNIIVEGHGRYLALKEMGVKECDCIRLDHLTDEERRAYTLAHNQLTMETEWDDEILQFELDDLAEFDMEALGFDLFGEEEEHERLKTERDEDEGYYGDARERTNKGYKLDIDAVVNHTSDFWQMPIINNDNFIPEDIIGFNYAMSSKDKNVGIHFYLDDYQFERVWNEPDKYIDVLSEYECAFSPDFSLYMDMSMPAKIWNIYRSRLIGAYWQANGIKVVPTISWAEPETFGFCFKGIQKGSTVSISTIGVKRDKDALEIWTQGMNEMIKQIEPNTILVYGGALDYDYGGINVIYYNNEVLDRWKESKNNGW